MEQNSIHPPDYHHTQRRFSSILAMTRANLAYAAWVQALIAMGGSLYLSEVMRFPPCSLCWYQRILMYPLVVIIPVGILLRDMRLRFYVLPISILGTMIAIYHNLLTYGIIKEDLVPCSMGISCTTRWIDWFGFITIPLLSLTAFVVITFLILFYQLEDFTNDQETLA